MIICIVGPTAVGKTALSIKLAKIYNGEIINADSTQVYIGMDIGTAKITEKEKMGIKHHLFDIVDVNTNYTVFDYQRDCRSKIAEIKARGHVPILVGGSGLYIKAALYNYVFDENEKKTNNYENFTNEELYNLAIKKDPNMNIHINNRQRLIRFLNKEQKTTEECYPLYDVIYIGLTTDRNTLYERINNRVDKMFEEGLITEAKSFYDLGLYSKALNTAIGYKELYKYFKGEISLEEAKELIKKNSRHYAKRQYTWFNNQMDINWFNVDFTSFDNTIKEVINFIDKTKENN